MWRVPELQDHQAGNRGRGCETRFGVSVLYFIVYCKFKDGEAWFDFQFKVTYLASYYRL